MVLLRGLNYDFTGQTYGETAYPVGIGDTTLRMINTEGFTTNDYILFEPGTERSEIIKVSSVTNSTTMVISAFTFAHDSGLKVFRMPYNQMKFYSCATATGTYALITSSTKNMNYADIYTTHEYVPAATDLYFKRTFYNSTTTTESDISIAEYWETNDEELYITPEEMRVFMQLSVNDKPNSDDIRTIIRMAQDNVDLDCDTSNEKILRIATFMMAKFYILRALATKSISKGYVTVNAEGRTITKAYQELVLEAENTFNEYKDFINDNLRSEVTKTNFLNDTSIIDSDVRQNFLDIMDGVSNAEDYNYQYRFFSYYRASRYT